MAHGSEIIIADAHGLFSSPEFRAKMAPELTEWDIAVEAATTAIQCSDEFDVMPGIEDTASKLLELIRKQKG